MKLQTCIYKSYPNAGWERGVACVKAFGLSDVLWIIDINGNKIKEPFAYALCSTMNEEVQSFIDTDKALGFNK